MSNIELFNEYFLQILGKLEDCFPIPTQLDSKEFVGSVEIEHLKPYWQGEVVFDQELRWYMGGELHKKLSMYEWKSVEEVIAQLIGRSLSPIEIERLHTSGMRPLTSSECMEQTAWEERAQNRKLAQDEIDERRKIFIGTIMFLVAEGYVRLIDGEAVPPDEWHLPIDWRIKNHQLKNHYVLTARGFTQVSKYIKDGRLGEGETWIQKARNYIGGKSLDASATVVADALIRAILMPH
ncbi:MAG: hypothetical protein PHY62_05995 [Gallionella sp.]|nr:hypothetical protein [Gallionella sp.]